MTSGRPSGPAASRSALGRACRAVAAAVVLLVVSVTTGRTPATAQSPSPGNGSPTTTTASSTPAPPSTPELKLLTETPWVKPGGELKIVVTALNVPDPSAIDVGVSLFPRITNRADLSASFTGDGLRTAIWQTPGGSVHLSDLPAAADGSRTITIPTQDPLALLDRSRARIQAGIYPVELQLLDPQSGDPISRLITHLLSPDSPKDGTRMGVVTVLPISARPAIAADGTRTGPPDGWATMTAIAAGLAAVPTVPVTAVASPETLAALGAGAPATAKALAAALGNRPIVARPYVPLRVPALGEQAGPILTAQMAAGKNAITAALGRPPTSSAWIADEPLDPSALSELASFGVNQLIVSATDLAQPPSSRAGSDRQAPPTPTPRQPIAVTAGGGRSVQALIADPTLATHTDPATAAADQPLAAHQLLTELTGIALLPQVRGGLVPLFAGLDGTSATVLPQRGWRPTQAFLTEFLKGLEHSPLLVGVDPNSAFASGGQPAATSTTASSARRTTTTLAPDERSLERLAPVDSRLGRTITNASATVVAHEAVLPDTPKVDVPPSQLVLVAASADLPVDEQLRRLDLVSRLLQADLDKIRIPGGIDLQRASRTGKLPPMRGRDLVLAARTGQLPVGIVNDAPSQAHVLLRLSSEKLEFQGGSDRLVTLGRQNTTEYVAVRAKTAGAFPVRVTLLTPDGRRVLADSEYRVRSNSLPGVGIAVSVAAGLVLAFWWGKTLIFHPRGAHLRGRT